MSRSNGFASGRARCYVLDRLVIADQEYDRLFGQLRRLEESFPDNPTAST
jgi:NAD-dependent DNA ligase